ncbi:hypothetical protein BT93_E1094 [Corymbia citriodora subsp. variegata]|nr:hypothetical protein BT93_E1094 [Corymbia citriodora subsp. variegata]
MDKNAISRSWRYAVKIERLKKGAPTFCSWAWRKLLQLREAALSFFRWKIGNGQTVSLWFDPWLASGLLSRRYSHADIYRLPLHCDTKVADLFSNEGTSIREELQAVQDPLPVISDSPDSLQWIPQNSGLFSIPSAWNVLRRQGRLVPWPSFIWDKAIIPRYQFLLWIISRNRLPTQTFLISIGRLPSGTCVFCKVCPDSIKHLFFECAIPNSLATLWAFKCNIPWSNRPWLLTIQWLTDQLSLTNFHSDITKFSFAALCYVIWKTRNNMLFRSAPLCVPSMLQHLIKALKDKALTYKGVPDTPRNRRLQCCWGLDPSIFL